MALHDSQRDTSSTRSGISDGQITITDQAGQAELTPGKSIEDIIAGLNREVETGRDTSGSLSNNLDEDEIKAKFVIASTFVKETATYIGNRGKEVDRAKKALDTEKEKTADERDDALVAQLEQQYKTALIENKTWLPGGTGRKVVNALNAAVGGNLSAGATQFVQMGVANYLQQEGATLLGQWTHEGKLTEGSPLHAALHGAVGCLGAAAGGGDCGAGGMGAATSSLLTNLFTDQPNETFAEKEAKRDIIVGLTTAMALGTNLDPGTAMNSAFSSLDNNWITKEMNDAADQARASTDDQELKDTITRQIHVISDGQEQDHREFIKKVLIQAAEEGWTHERAVEEANRYWSDQHLNPAEDVLPDYEPAYDSDYQRREFFRGIRKTGNDTVDQLGGGVGRLADGIGRLIDEPAQMASDTWDGIKSIPGNIYDGAANTGQSAIDWATSEFPGMELEEGIHDYLNTAPDEYAGDLIKSGAGLYGARRFELLWRKTPNTPSSGGRFEESLGSSDRGDLFPDDTLTHDNARTVGQNEASHHSGVDDASNTKPVRFSGGNPVIDTDLFSPGSVSNRTIDNRKLYGYQESGPYLGSFKRPEVDDSKLQNIVNQMYKGDRSPTGTLGTGSTADSARWEFETGKLYKGTDHLKNKAPQLENALNNWLRASSTASQSDISAATEMLKDLQKAQLGELND